MNKHNVLRKGLVCGIIVLLVGISLMPIAGSLSIERVSTASQIQNSNLGDDITPPVTTIYFDPPYPDGDNGWYVSDVTITLEATDDMSGVDVIKYLLDDSDWLTYTGPFTVESDGCHRITYYAIDKAGNVEQPSEVIRFGIDQTPPTIELTVEKIGFRKWLITADVYDETSGINRIEFYVDGEYLGEVTDEPFEWVYSGSYGENATSVVYDNAGNSAFVTVKDSDIHSYSSQSAEIVEKSSLPIEESVLIFDGNTTIVSIQPPAQCVEKGEEFTAGIYVEPSEPIIDVGIEIIYFDPTLIQADRVDAVWDLFEWPPVWPPPGFDPGIIDNINGSISYIIGGWGVAFDPGYFCNITFIAQQKPGTSPLDIQNVRIMGNINHDPLPSTVIDGEVTVRYSCLPPVPELNGTMGENGWYVSDVLITFVGDCAYIEYKINDDPWQIYTDPFMVTVDGEHTLCWYAVDSQGNISEGCIDFKIDQTPPTTTHEFDGMLGDNDWFVSDVTVTLNAEDETSGVDYTMYKLDDDTEWQNYTGPFVITEDGYHILQYYSVDNAGNIEDMKFCWFKIDQIIYYHDLIILPKGDDQVEFIANVIDKTSNIERVEFYIDDVLEYTDYEFPFKWNYLGEGSRITLGSVVYDIAGNGAAWCIPISNNLETYGLGYPLQINEIENHFSGEMVLSDTSLFLNTGFSDVILYGIMGENGWYISDVIIEFTSAENNTYYRINGGGWEIYTGPIIVSDDGWYFLEYYSEYEPVKYVIFKIDQTPPLIDPIVRDAGFYRWEIIACVYDETSNVNRVEFYVDNELVKEDGEFPFTYTYNGFQGNIKAIVYDKAGHSTENSSITSQSQNHISSRQSSSSSSDQSVISILPSSGTKIVEKSSMPTFNGNTLYVGGSGPGNYTTIQEAIDNASDGDTVFVFDDSSPYYENLLVDKSISIIGENKENTVIDGGGSGDVVTISADGVSIIEFTIRNSGSSGIEIDGSEDCLIQSCILCNNGGAGLRIVNSSFNTIINCFFLSNSDGIVFGNADDQSNTGNSILYNIIQYNSNCGIRFDHTWYNIGNIVKHNNISYNGGGIGMVTCESNEIAFNEIFNNDGYGIGLMVCQCGGEYNKVHHNNFISNNDGGVQAHEFTGGWTPSNYWYSEYDEEGNYWSDYTGPDNDSNGIGDIPYDIDGDTNNSDIYPMMNPYNLTAPSDKTPPVTIIEFGEPYYEDLEGNIYITSDTPIYLNAMDDESGVNATYYKINDGNWEEYIAPFSIPEDCNHAIYFYSIDNAGNVEIIKNENVGVDNYPPYPVSSPPWPNGNNGWYTSSVFLSFADAKSGIFCVWYRVDGGPYKFYYYPILIGGDGYHTVGYLAFDNLGNEGTGSSSIKIDQTPPTTMHMFDGIIGDNDWFVSGITVTLYAEDETSGVDYTMYKLDDGEWTTYTDPFVVTEDGEHTLCYYSVDLAGNVEDVKGPFEFKIDQTPPTVELTAEKIGFNRWLLTADISDETSGVNRVEFYVNDEYLGEVTEPPYKWIWTGMGGHTVGVAAYDHAGNSAEDEKPLSHSHSQSQSSNQQYPQSSSNDQQNIPYAPLFCEPAHGVIGDLTVESGQAGKDIAGKDIPSHERPRPILDVEFLGISRVKITNIGTATAYNVHLKLELQGGFVLIGRVREIVIDEIEPDESVIRDLGRVFGFGRVILVLSLWADNVPKVEDSCLGYLMGFFFFFLS